jgi:protoporphyrinogen oxidase
MTQKVTILGAGMTGLAAGLASGAPIYEAAAAPGGICTSYYLHLADSTRLPHCPNDAEAYRFELGGGHWIFGLDAALQHQLETFTPLKYYARKSAVYFARLASYVPYPLQHHLRFLPQDIARQALADISASELKAPATMHDWLQQCFGSTLCDLFFYPFHEVYTAGLYPAIAPQDAYKSPVNRALVVQGASVEAPPVGYNTMFAYPTTDLAFLASRLAEQCDIRYHKRVVKIDVAGRLVSFADGSVVRYDQMISTLPLHTMIELTGLTLATIPDPYTAVLVLNIGAVRGERCPDQHWLYIPDSRSGFHRVGFYSNVDNSFLPRSAWSRQDRVSMYVERAYRAGQRPSEHEITRYADSVRQELCEWGFIQEIEVIDPTWIDVAYTWSYPGSSWKQQALQILEQHGIFQSGRYGRWQFQGIAESIREGFAWRGKQVCVNR